jgi:hypothetical protein
MYFTGDLSGQYPVEMAENSFACNHFIFRCTDFDSEDGGKTFVRNFGNISHLDTALTHRIEKNINSNSPRNVKTPNLISRHSN